MKNKIIIGHGYGCSSVVMILIFILILAGSLIAQQQQSVDSVKIKYEQKAIELKQQIEKRAFEIAVNDPIALERINQLLSADPVYNQLAGQLKVYNDLLEALTPKKEEEEE